MEDLGLATEFDHDLGLDFDHLFDESLPAHASGSASNDSSRRRRDEQLLSEADRAKLERERAKNRKASAKFREKQKEKQQTLEAKHQAASDELQHSRQQHASLAHQNSLLEALLAVRDSTVEVLQRAKAEEPLAAQARSMPSGAALTSVGALCMGALGMGRGSRESTAQQAVGKGLATPAAAPTAGAAYPGTGPTAAPRGGHISSSLAAVRHLLGSNSSSNSSTAAGGSGCDSVLASTSAGGERQMPQITCHYGWDEAGDTDLRGLCQTADPEVIAEVQRFSPGQMIARWRDYARSAREVLLEYDVTGNEGLLSRLRPLMTEKAVLMTLVVHHNPDCMRQLMASSADHGLPKEQQNEKWDAVVAAMKITPAQRLRFLELCGAYERLVQQARSEMSRAVSAIEAASTSYPETVGALSEMMGSYLQALEGAASLSSYPDQEFVALLELLNGMGRTSTPLQQARAAAMAYPYFPDTLGLMQAIMRLPDA